LAATPPPHSSFSSKACEHVAAAHTSGLGRGRRS
jgi:hypothetical protein